MSLPFGAVLAALAAIPTTLIYDGMPPDRFKGNRTVVVRFYNNLDTLDACGLPPAGKTFLGCVRGDVIFMPNPCPRGDAESFAKIMCHELGHKNGWPAEHGP